MLIGPDGYVVWVGDGGDLSHVVPVRAAGDPGAAALEHRNALARLVFQSIEV